MVTGIDNILIIRIQGPDGRHAKWNQELNRSFEQGWSMDGARIPTSINHLWFDHCCVVSITRRFTLAPILSDGPCYGPDFFYSNASQPWCRGSTAYGAIACFYIFSHFCSVGWFSSVTRHRLKAMPSTSLRRSAKPSQRCNFARSP